MMLILGFCRSWASAQGLLMATINIQVQCPGLVLLWVWLQSELVCAVLMLPPSISDSSLEGED